jgi:hypothetical protein
MLSPTKRVYSKFCPLMVKMHAKSQQNDVAKNNLNSLCDVEVIIRLPCILLLLECVHALIKVAQCKDVFVATLWKLWKSFTSSIPTNIRNLKT